MTVRHTANIAEMSTNKKISNLCNYIIQKILLYKIKKNVKKKIIYFIHSFFMNEIVPLFFPQLQGVTIQFADIILWCIQNKIPETFGWGKNMIKDISKIYKENTILPMNEAQVAHGLYWAGNKTIKHKKRSSIGSKKNIKYRKKNTKITMKKAMMNRMMFPK